MCKVSTGKHVEAATVNVVRADGRSVECSVRMGGVRGLLGRSHDRRVAGVKHTHERASQRERSGGEFCLG